MIHGTIDVKDIGLMVSLLNKKIIEHLMNCSVCKPGVRCMQYILLKEIEQNLKKGDDNDQKN